MAVTVQGFGRLLEPSSIQVGDIVLGLLGSDAYLVMRVSYSAGEAHDLVLTQLRGAPSANITFPRMTNRNTMEYASIEGPLVIRPCGVPIPTRDFSNCMLVIDGEGTAFLSINTGGVNFELASGISRRPSDERAYYGNWELLQILSKDREQVIARFGAASAKDRT